MTRKQLDIIQANARRMGNEGFLTLAVRLMELADVISQYETIGAHGIVSSVARAEMLVIHLKFLCDPFYAQVEKERDKAISELEKNLEEQGITI